MSDEPWPPSGILLYQTEDGRTRIQCRLENETLPGPAGNHDRIRTPENAGGLVTPAVEAQLNERQRRMVALLVSGERLTSRRCETEFGVTRDTATRDFALLLKLGIAEKLGRGRSVHYLQATSG